MCIRDRSPGPMAPGAAQGAPGRCWFQVTLVSDQFCRIRRRSKVEFAELAGILTTFNWTVTELITAPAGSFPDKSKRKSARRISLPILDPNVPETTEISPPKLELGLCCSMSASATDWTLMVSA